MTSNDHISAPARFVEADGVRDALAEHAPSIDYANLPDPAEGVVVTMFITVRSIARSRDFYSRVLGGTVVLEENPCIVKLANSWILMNPGGPPTPDKPGITVPHTTSGPADRVRPRTPTSGRRPRPACGGHSPRPKGI